MTTKLHHPVPKVGDTVVLNARGLQQCFGHRYHPHMRTLRMKITSVAPESLTAPEFTYPVEVDDPEIGMLLIRQLVF